jgi:hypothetical protein
VGNECFITHTRQARMDGGFGIVGDDSLWLWERKRRHLSLDNQCIDGAANGDNNAQQNKQFLHDTSIAYENGKWKMQNGSVSSACAVRDTTHFALFGIKYVATLGDSTTVVME